MTDSSEFLISLSVKHWKLTMLVTCVTFLKLNSTRIRSRSIFDVSIPTRNFSHKLNFFRKNLLALASWHDLLISRFSLFCLLAKHTPNFRILTHITQVICCGSTKVLVSLLFLCSHQDSNLERRFRRPL